MCGIFLAVDPAAYACETRAIRLNGHATSVRLEAGFWNILEEIAEREAMPLSRFVSVLHGEILDKHGDVPNFASLLRVTCLQYLRHVGSPEGGRTAAGSFATAKTAPALA